MFWFLTLYRMEYPSSREDSNHRIAAGSEEHCLINRVELIEIIAPKYLSPINKKFCSSLHSVLVRQQRYFVFRLRVGLPGHQEFQFEPWRFFRSTVEKVCRTSNIELSSARGNQLHSCLSLLTITRSCHRLQHAYRAHQVRWMLRFRQRHSDWLYCQSWKPCATPIAINTIAVLSANGCIQINIIRIIAPILAVSREAW